MEPTIVNSQRIFTHLLMKVFEVVYLHFAAFGEATEQFEVQDVPVAVVGGLFLGGFKDLWGAGGAGIGAYDAKCFESHEAAADVFVAVDAGAEGFLGVVEVPGLDGAIAVTSKDELTVDGKADRGGIILRKRMFTPSPDEIPNAHRAL